MIELPLGSIFYTTQPFMKKLTTVKTSREKDLTKEQFFLWNLKLHNGMALSKKNKERTEAVAWWCSIKEVFLEILQNLQESNCARAPF